MCELTVQTMDDKQTKEYIQQFLCLNQQYGKVGLSLISGGFHYTGQLNCSSPMV